VLATERKRREPERERKPDGSKRTVAPPHGQEHYGEHEVDLPLERHAPERRIDLPLPRLDEVVDEKDVRQQRFPRERGQCDIPLRPRGVSQPRINPKQEQRQAERRVVGWQDTARPTAHEPENAARELAPGIPRDGQHQAIPRENDEDRDGERAELEDRQRAEPVRKRPELRSRDDELPDMMENHVERRPAAQAVEIAEVHTAR
jgi:hypothetical protein